MPVECCARAAGAAEASSQSMSRRVMNCCGLPAFRTPFILHRFPNQPLPRVILAVRADIMMPKPGNTRRAFLLQAGIGAALLGAQEPQNIVVPQALPPIKPNASRSTVSLVTGDNRRRMIREALVALDPKLRTAISHKKYVLIKANLTSVTNQLASTHPEMLCGSSGAGCRQSPGTRSTVTRWA